MKKMKRKMKAMRKAMRKGANTVSQQNVSYVANVSCVAKSGSTDACANSKKWSQQHYGRPQFVCGTRASKRFPPYKVGLCHGLK